jgi:hypothetical protein
MVGVVGIHYYSFIFILVMFAIYMVNQAALYRSPPLSRDLNELALAPLTLAPALSFTCRQPD